MIRFESPSDSMRGRMNGTSNTDSTRPRFGGPPGRFNNMGSNAGNTTQAPILLGIGGGLLFLSISLLGARLWSRRRPGSRLSLDDWTVLAATVLAIGQYALLSVAVVYGLGRFSRFVSLSRRRTTLELLFISQVIWYWSITLVKLSVAFMLLKVKHTRSWKIFLHSIITLIVLSVIVQTCFQFLQCRPFRVYWDPRVFRQGPVICFSRKVINANIVAFSSIQVGLDLVFSFIPITFIRKLNRPRREKVLMCVLMALGIFASIAAIIRTLTLQEFYTTPDVFRINVTVALWAVVEQQFALIAATIPTLKSFMEQILVKIGLYFYDAKTETEARDKLVQFGFLGNDDVLEKDEKTVERSRKMSDAAATTGSPRSERKMKDEWTISEMLESINDKDVEDMLTDSMGPTKSPKDMV